MMQTRWRGEIVSLHEGVAFGLHCVHQHDVFERVCAHGCLSVILIRFADPLVQVPEDFVDYSCQGAVSNIPGVEGLFIAQVSVAPLQGGFRSRKKGAGGRIRVFPLGGKVGEISNEDISNYRRMYSNLFDCLFR